MTSFRVLLIIIFTVVYLIIIGFIDFNIITPLLPIPEHICYYHENDPPIWIDLFYLDGMGHTEPPYSLLHMSILFLISLFAAILTSKRVDNFLIARNL